MAARASWTGSINWGLIYVPVSAYPAIGAAPSEPSFRDICECCTAPFSQTNVCPAGKAKDTEAARKRGETNLTPVLKGVEHNGSWVAIDPLQLQIIEDEARVTAIDVEFIPAEEAPFWQSTGSYYLKVPKTAKGAEAHMALFHAALRESGAVAIGRWSPKTRQSPVLIYDYGDALMMNTLPMLNQLRDPAPVAGVVDPGQVSKAARIIQSNMVHYDPTQFEGDPLVEKRAALVEAVLGGKTVTPSPAVAPPSPAADLDALLKQMGA